MPDLWLFAYGEYAQAGKFPHPVLFNGGKPATGGWCLPDGAIFCNAGRGSARLGIGTPVRNIFALGAGESGFCAAFAGDDGKGRGE